MTRVAALVHYEEQIHKIVMLLGAIILCLAALYGILLNKTIHNVVIRQGSEKQIARINTEIGQLETEDIALKDGVTSQAAETLGFVEIAPQFLSLNHSLNSQVGSGLSFNK